MRNFVPIVNEVLVNSLPFIISCRRLPDPAQGSSGGALRLDLNLVC